MENNPFEKHEPRKTFDELNLKNLTAIYEMLLTFSEEKKNSLVVLDDVTSDLKSIEVSRLLAKIVQNRRHLKVSIHLLVQSFISVPLGVRKLITHLALFRSNNKKEVGSLADELLFIEKKQLEAVLQYTYKEPHSFLFVDVQNQKYYRKFALLTF